MEYATIGGQLTDREYAKTAPEPPRTLDGLRSAVDRLRDVRRSLDNTLDRINPQPCETGNQVVSGSLGRQPYAASLDDIHREIDRIESIISVLGTHI